jgi:hypothetical protein
MSGLVLCHASYGIMPGRALEEGRSCMYAACCKAYSHKNIGTFAPISIACVSSTKVWFNLSAAPFCDGEYGAVVCNSIPCSRNHLFRLSLTNSVSWSHQKALDCMSLVQR